LVFNSTFSTKRLYGVMQKYYKFVKDVYFRQKVKNVLFTDIS